MDKAIRACCSKEQGRVVTIANKGKAERVPVRGAIPAIKPIIAFESAPNNMYTSSGSEVFLLRPTNLVTSVGLQNPRLCTSFLLRRIFSGVSIADPSHTVAAGGGNA